MNNKTLVKICGLRREEDVAIINEACPDYAGFIINFPKSFRSLSYNEVTVLAKRVRPEIQTVGVFVDDDPSEIIRLLNENVIQVAQLHGNESEETIRRIQAEAKKPVIKAFLIETEKDLKVAEASPADFVLLDKGRGDGVPFDWSLLKNFSRPYFLAGGLTPENVRIAIDTCHPYAVDVSSGVETDRFKDAEKIRRLMKGLSKISH